MMRADDCDRELGLDLWCEIQWIVMRHQGDEVVLYKLARDKR